MLNKTTIIILIIFIFLTGMNVWALRINRPPSLGWPITQDEVSNLNKYLEDSYNIQQGRFELDIVTTPKFNAKNGEMWLIWSSPTVRLQFKARNTVWTL